MIKYCEILRFLSNELGTEEIVNANSAAKKTAIKVKKTPHNWESAICSMTI